MARSVSRKSTKKCPAGQHGRKSHMRAGKRVKAQCVKTRSRTTKRSMKSLTMTAPRKSSKKSSSRKSSSRSRVPKRVLGTGPCTSRTIRDCTKDSRCQVKRRPKGGKTCAFAKGSGIVNREAMNLAGLADAYN